MACSESALTGVDGNVVVSNDSGGSYKKIARITQWDVNPVLDTQTDWGDSDGAGYTLRAPGRKGATATTEGKFDTFFEVYDVFKPDETRAKLCLYMNANLFWDFPCALCTSFSLTVNVDTQEVIGWTAEWGNDGIFYYPGDAGAVCSLPSANSV